MTYEIKLANKDDLDLILKLYLERINWFKKNNIKQWSKYFENHPISEFKEAINKKEYYIIKQNNEIIAGFELTSDNRNLDHDNVSAYYIYKIVTKVGYKDIVKIIFAKCREIAQENNKKYLRLTCLKSNKKLNNIYERHNFKLIEYGYNKHYSYSLRELNIVE